MHRPPNRGFTLIELLVVISIIGLLSSTVLVSLDTARVKANDVNRKIELRQLQKALELYYSNHGAYPSTSGWYGNSINGGSRTDWIPGLVSDGDIGSLPQDPVHTPTACAGWGGTFLYNSNGTDYKLLSHCPQKSNVASTPSSDTFYDPSRPGSAWQISTPGAAGW